MKPNLDCTRPRPADLKSDARRADARFSVLVAAAWLGLWATMPAGAQTVGYLFVTMTNGYNFVANPFNAQLGLATNNFLTNVVPSAPDGTRAYTWDASSQTFSAPATYSNSLGGWVGNFDLPPGKGFVLWANKRWTNIFNGVLPVGTFRTPILSSNRFCLVASAIYLSQPASLTALQFPRVDGENVYVYKAGRQSYTDAVTWFSGFGWFDPTGAVNLNGPVIAAAQSFFVQNPSANNLSWAQIYGSGFAATPMALSAGAAGSSGATVSSLVIGPGGVSLGIANPGGQPYTVQFSADGSQWNSIATGQTGPTWSGPLAGGGQGFYLVTQP